MTEKEQLIFQAYKSMIYKNAETGFLRQHMSDIDYYAMNEYPEVFFNVLEIRTDKDIVKTFFEKNPERLNDIEFCKKAILSTKDSYMLYDRIDLFKNKEKELIDDLEFNYKLIKKHSGHSLYVKELKVLKTNEVLMRKCLDIDNFSFNWFDLPIPDDIKYEDYILRDVSSYKKLSEKQKNINLTEKVFTQIKNVSALESMKEHIPDAFIKSSKELQDVFIKKGIFLNDISIYDRENTLYETLISLEKNLLTKKVEGTIIKENQNLNYELFKNDKNILELIDFFKDSQKIIWTNNTTTKEMKSLFKTIAKHNKEIKKLIKNPESAFFIDNIGVINSKDLLDKMKKEFTYYYMRNEMISKPDSKIKVKI